MPDDLGSALLILARNAIAAELGAPTRPEPAHPALEERGATFVTLTQEGHLRGCIGSLEPNRPLGVDVRSNARAAAFGDPRFSPLRPSELQRTRIEVSLLSPAMPIYFRDEPDAVAQLRPGVDGVILEWDGKRGTFLPQVWENLHEPQLFLNLLKQKAGLPADFWDSDVRLDRYEVQKWKEPPKI
ncbi:MAG: AmmeMemoRadiSam system protein A [Burkholderiales bacterium]|nr:AmmeMemoRadiSam system protein A [Burkholderiales bacterium]